MNQRRQPKIARKPPQQSRSRATVTAILDATIRIFDQEGSDAASTTRIAEVAGVSVGTLYQYFSNRDAILDALQDREFARAQEFMSAALAPSEEASSEAVARTIIEGLLALYAAAPALHRILAIEGLRVTPADRVQAFDLKIVNAIRAFLATTELNIRRRNLDAAAFVVYQSVRATMLARLLENPPNFDDAALVDELTDLVLRYLVDAVEPA